MKTKKTIVFLHPHFMKPAGASKVVLEQASGMTSRGYKCIIVTTKCNQSVISPYKNIKIIEIGGRTTGDLSFWLTFPLFFRKLSRILCKIDFDFLFCHSLSIYWGYFFKKQFPKTKLVYFMHDFGLPYTDVKEEIDGLGLTKKIVIRGITPLLKKINSDIFHSSDYIIANSEVTARFILKKYHIKTDIILWPGVDINIFKPNNKKRGDYIFSVGRLEKLKKFDLIIKGFAQYLNTNPSSETKLYIIGDGVEMNTLKKLANKIGVERSVRFLGSQNSEKISKIASSAKAGVFLCSQETFGVAAAESLSCGTPIIGVKKNGIGVILSKSHAGLSVDGNPESLSKAISILLTDKNMSEKLSREASSFAWRELSWEKHIDKLDIFFENLK